MDTKRPLFPHLKSRLSPCRPHNYAFPSPGPGPLLFPAAPGRVGNGPIDAERVGAMAAAAAAVAAKLSAAAPASGGSGLSLDQKKKLLWGSKKKEVAEEAAPQASWVWGCVSGRGEGVLDSFEGTPAVVACSACRSGWLQPGVPAPVQTAPAASRRAQPSASLGAGSCCRASSPTAPSALSVRLLQPRPGAGGGSERDGPSL